MVTLFSTPTCYPCKAAERKLQAEGVNYTKVDLTADPAALARLKEIRQSDMVQTPLFELNGDGELADISGLSGIIKRAKETATSAYGLAATA